MPELFETDVARGFSDLHIKQPTQPERLFTHIIPGVEDVVPRRKVAPSPAPNLPIGALLGENRLLEILSQASFSGLKLLVSWIESWEVKQCSSAAALTTPVQL